ncbi:MAG: CPBP family intramembrane metalloprotease [Bacteroidia bacterium]|nr:CPBP family intramembrane metalloprotease [Bacteroidia bacterium]
MEPVEKERQSWLKLSLIFLYILAYGFLNVIGGDGELGFNMDNDSVITMLKVMQAVSVILVFILPALLFAAFWTKPRIHYLGITKKPLFSTIILAAVGMVMAMPMINWLSELNQQMSLPEMFSGVEAWMKNSEAKAMELTDAFTRGTSVGSLLLNLFVVAFMAAVSEELFFRGMLQKVLIECFKNKHVAVWIGAALFSAFHMQFYGFVPRMLMGAYLGYLFLWSGSLYPSIVAHFVNNGMAVLLVWLANRGTIFVDADKVGMEQGEFIYVIVSIVMVVSSLFLVYRLEQKKRNVQSIE